MANHHRANTLLNMVRVGDYVESISDFLRAFYNLQSLVRTKINKIWR